MGEAAQVRTPDIQLFRDVFNASPIGIAVENLEGQPLFVNPAFCSFLGFTAAELLSKHCVDFSPPEDAQKDWKLFQQLRAGSIDHYQLEKRYFRRDGSLVWGRLIISILNGPSPLVLAMVQDITEKKKAEEALIRHAAVIESSHDAIASGTLDGIIVSWNSGAERLYGYTEAEAIGKSIMMLVPPELPDEEKKILEMLRTGRQIEHFETVRVTKTGKKINVSLTISPIKDASGRTVGCSGIARDITAQKRAEEALRASEERLRLAQWAARIGTFDVNLRTGVDIWTPEMEALYGLSPGGFGGTLTAFENLIHPDDRKRIVELTQEMIRTGQPTEAEWRVVWPDGSVHWIAGRGQVLMDASGEPSRMLGVSIDVTERRLAEEALRGSEQRFRLAAQAGKMYSFEWDVATDIVVRSPERVKVLGATEPIRVSHQQFVNAIYSEDRPKFIATIAALNPEKPTAEVIYRVQGSDGRLVWLRSSGRAFFDSEGKMTRVIGMVADVTDVKRAEEALAGMTRKLIESQEQERTRIGRELHDDINQRLAILAIDLEQLEENPSEVRYRLRELRNKTTEIANDVQALSHELHSSKLEILGVVSGMRGWCREFGERRKVEIDFKSDVSSALPFDTGLCLLRVLQEALHNAVKHSEVKRIEVKLAAHSHEVHLTISDSGKGFDVEAAKQGRGLGLTSMQERVRLVNGTISIESKPMGGTTIRIHVPLKADSAQLAAG